MDRTSGYTQVKAPRGTFPLAGSTSSGWTTTTYTQTASPRAEGAPSAAWSRWLTRDRRPQRSKQGLFWTLPGARPGARWTIAHPQSSDDIPSYEIHLTVDYTHAASCALSGAPWDGAKNCNDRRRNKFQLLIDAAVLLQVRYRFCLSRSLLPYRWWDIFLTKQGSMYIF